MELYELHDNAMVRSASGEDLGEIERFVIDPSSREVTHLVVKEGLIFKDRRVISVDEIDHVDAEGPVLSAEIRSDDLPLFETEHYVPVDEVTRGRVDSRLGEASMWRYPTLTTGFYPAYPGMAIPYRTESEMTTVRDLNIPSGTAVVDDRTPVESASGQVVGTVTEVAIDDEGRLSHLAVDVDGVEGDRIVPSHWIESVGENRIELAVGEEALRHLEQVR